MTLSSATTPGQSDNNERVLRIPQSSCITGASPSDCLVSYLGHSLVVVGSYPSTEMQSVNSTTEQPRFKVRESEYTRQYSYKN